jgi:hypothetical protein
VCQKHSESPNKDNPKKDIVKEVSGSLLEKLNCTTEDKLWKWHHHARYCNSLQGRCWINHQVHAANWPVSSQRTAVTHPTIGDEKELITFIL